MARAQATPARQDQLPDAPTAHSEYDTVELAEASTENSATEAASLAEQQQTPAADAPQAAPATPIEPAQSSTGKTTSNTDLKQAEKQRIMGVMPAFTAVNSGVAAPLTPSQKFQLMFRSTTDVYVFSFAALTAGIGQANNSHAGYGQGAAGYFKRFGASYTDTADGNFWGNAVLPVLFHEDPRYFRKGTGTFTKRLLYSMSTAVMCRRDNGTYGPNYANVLGNIIAGGISNAYYPAADRGVGQTFQSAATVTAEGMIGAALFEFWPDVVQRRQMKKQARLDAEAAKARDTQNPNPSARPPQ